MASVRSARNLRWTAVGAGTAALVAVPVLIAAAPVRPTPDPAPRELMAAVIASGAVAYQALVQVDGRAGLPGLPFAVGALAMLDTSTTVRSWWKSPASWRTDVLSAGGQTQEFTSRGGTVTYDYESNVARPGSPVTGPRAPRPTDLLPGPASRLLLSWAGPTDTVRALPARRVAGVAAAGLEVVPADPGTSLGRIDLWADPATGLPLLLQVYARGATEPTLRSAALDVAYGTPAPDVLAPRLATSVQWQGRARDVVAFLAQLPSTAPPATLGPLPRTDSGVTGVATYGTGYARVALVVLPPQLVPRILDAVTVTDPSAAPAPDRPTTTTVGRSRVATLSTSLLQVAVVVTPGGAGYLLAGTLTLAAMTALVRADEPALAAGVA